MVRDTAGRMPRGLAVEDHIADRQVGYRFGDRRVMLEQPVARIQLHVGAVLEREHPDSIELPLEDPLSPGKPLLRERRRHRHNPCWERCCFLIQHAIREPRLKSQTVWSSSRLSPTKRERNT